MSSKNLEKVIQRAISDAAFRRLLQSNPDAALRGFKLTSEEVTALRASDAGRLMSLGIDQRMSKAYAMSEANFANRASVDGLSIGGTAISDQGVARLAYGAGDPESISDSAVAPGDASRATMSDASDVAYRVRDVDPVSVGDPVIIPADANAASDAIEDQSHAFSASRAAEVETVRSAVRDVEPSDLRGGGLVAPVEGSPESSAFQNTDASASDAIEDQSHGFSASRSADMEASTRSAIRDVAPTELRGEVSDYTGTTASHIRDVAPPDVSATTSYSGDDLAGPGYLANSDTDAVRAVRDVTDVDLGAATTTNLTGDAPFVADADSAESYEPTFHSAGTSGAPSSDAIEDASHAFSAARSDAFLSSEEASQYSVEANDTSSITIDEGQVSPATDMTATPEHQGGDAIGNTTTDPEISA
ncbi:MAG TPA: Os1348 family NHLP clan protein [Candidatus Limnocylindria bacterium]|nr:Os1348 family NHLP clan protein [Candidatus Limnocylindria bacterium]